MASRPDAPAVAQLGQQVVQPRFLCWLDIVGDPVRSTTWPTSLSPTGTGDADLDGFTFSVVDPSFVKISAVQFREGGAQSVTASLSGLIGPDNYLLNIIGDATNWRGRSARLWKGVADASGAAQGVIWSYYTGRMVSLSIDSGASAQTIAVTIESYLAMLSPPSNRTYLDQADFDAGDLSARATIAIASGISGSNAGMSGAGGGGGSGGNNLEDRRYVNAF